MAKQSKAFNSRGLGWKRNDPYMDDIEKIILRLVN